MSVWSDPAVIFFPHFPPHPRFLDWPPWGSQVIPHDGRLHSLTDELTRIICRESCSEDKDIGMRSVYTRRFQQNLVADTTQNVIYHLSCPVPGICLEAPSSHRFQNWL
jgi:hypothetical protein